MPNVKSLKVKSTMSCQSSMLPKLASSGSTQHNDTQHNDTQHNDTQHNDIQSLTTLSIMTLSLPINKS
jgi:hypothetical protein